MPLGSFAMVLVCLTARGATVASTPLPTAEEIVRRSVEANERDWQAAPEYSYSVTTRDLHGSKTKRVIMLFGSPYERLLKVNGRKLSATDERQEEHKFAEAFARRRSESSQEKANRVAAYSKERQGDHLMLQQLTSAFSFKLTGEKILNGRPVYILHASRRSGYQPPNMESRVLLGMEGDLFIDTNSFQWARVFARVISPVNIGGFLATVQPGTYFEMENMRVENGIWLQKHFRVESQSKILMLFAHGTKEDDLYFDYEATPEQYRPTPTR